jgi:hypothetical protein
MELHKLDVVVAGHYSPECVEGVFIESAKKSPKDMVLASDSLAEVDDICYNSYIAGS